MSVGPAQIRSDRALRVGGFAFERPSPPLVDVSEAEVLEEWLRSEAVYRRIRMERGPNAVAEWRVLFLRTLRGTERGREVIRRGIEQTRALLVERRLLRAPVAIEAAARELSFIVSAILRDPGAAGRRTERLRKGLDCPRLQRRRLVDANVLVELAPSRWPMAQRKEYVVRLLHIYYNSPFLLVRDDPEGLTLGQNIGTFSGGIAHDLATLGLFQGDRAGGASHGTGP